MIEDKIENIIENYPHLLDIAREIACAMFPEFETHDSNVREWFAARNAALLALTK